MGELDGRVTVITGAGRGIGREHALLFASEGAKVVVNDLGGNHDGRGSDAGPAEAVALEIRHAGGEAVADTHDISTWEGARLLIVGAVETFGKIDVVVNNAGILRDRFLSSMSEEEWDAIMRVHLKGHFAVLRHAVDHWRERTKAGEQVRASVINTASPSGLILINPGQANYGAAKAAIATLTQVAAKEFERYGVRVNAIAPAARTRLTLATPGLGDAVGAPSDGSFDQWDPANVSPLVAYLATEDASVTGEVFFVQGGRVQRLEGWSVSEELLNLANRPTVALLRERIARPVAA